MIPPDSALAGALSNVREAADLYLLLLERLPESERATWRRALLSVLEDLEGRVPRPP